MTDYEVAYIDDFEDPLTHFALFSDCDPTTFEVAIKEPKWQKAMVEEIAGIERNNTLELSDHPKGQKTIGVKWVYKTKLKENDEVDKYKARLVAKGYKQELGVDYKEAFADIARHDTIRMMIVLAVQNSRPLFQLDVKSVFLHRDLQEQKYAREILNRFKMKHYNSVTTPTEVGLKLTKDLGGKKVDSTLYKQIVGSLTYLTNTRLDVMHVVSLISRYMESPKAAHLLAVKRILRYLYH